jgi:ATP-dependent Lhr-like helicase
MRLGPFPTTTHWAQIHARIAAMVSADAPDSGTPGAFAPLAYPGYAGDRGDARGQGRRPGKRSAPGSLDECIADVADAGDPPSRSLLVFCQTRAQVERSAAALDEMLSEAGMPGQVGAHHGSLDTAHRESIEARFKTGALRILVSSASLELGLDLGHVDRVCQLGVPGSVNLVRQRAGRSGHRPGRTPRMHLFALTLNQLVEAEALRDRLAAGVIEASCVPDGPADVLAQHLAAMVAAGIECPDAMLEIVRAASPYRRAERETLDRLLALQAEPVADLPGEQAAALLSRSSGGRVCANPSAQRLVLTNAGTIPEFFEYDVVRADSGERVGTLDEEFAFESSPGQVVQLGRRSWRILRVRTGRVEVEPADADAVELPFWFGEGPGRSPEMSDAMLAAIARRGSSGLHPQAAAMLAESREVLGALPSPDRLVIERFPDPNGDRHVVLHTFAGARINRAWGLALRKRFCRQFNFELQAAATDDGILISLGVTSRFEPAEVARFVKATTVADVLTQALLDTPLFVTRFRWAANNALVLLKNDLRGRVPPQRQRSRAENLIACVFPDQLACVENLSGPREVPDHPLVQQALADCVTDYMDLTGLQRLLARIESGALAVHAVDTPAPSPLAEALIHAPRYSYLDEAAAEERRTRNFEAPAGRRERRVMPQSNGASADRAPAGPGLRPTADALERLLTEAGFLTAAEGERGVGLARPVPAGGWTRPFSQLVRERRAVSIRLAANGPALWAGLERVGWILALRPDAEFRPWIAPALVPVPAESRAEVLARLIAARRRVAGDASEATVAGLVGDARAPEAATG